LAALPSRSGAQSFGQRPSWRSQPGSARLDLPAFRDTQIILTIAPGILRGDTTYRIGGHIKQLVDGVPAEFDVQFPLSELDWPLNVAVVTGRLTLNYARLWEVGAEFHKSVTSNSGKMRDSDWGIYYLEDPVAWPLADSLDVYSLSDSKLDALVLDLHLRGFFHHRKRYTTFAGIGYLNQSFKFAAYDLDQWYPSIRQYFGVDLPHDKVPGLVGRYRVRYSIPYAEIGQEGRFLDFMTVRGAFAASPFVLLTDVDEHLLRNKENHGRCKGVFARLEVDLRLDHPRGWFLGLQLDYTRIAAKGKSDAQFGGVYDHTIDLKIHSDQVLFNAYTGLRFGRIKEESFPPEDFF